MSVLLLSFAGERIPDPRKGISAIGHGRSQPRPAKEETSDTAHQTTSTFSQWDQDFSKGVFDQSSSGASPSYCADGRRLHSTDPQRRDTDRPPVRPAPSGHKCFAFI